MAPRAFEGGYEAWPALDEIFPVTFQGINHNRGLEGGVIDGDREKLGSRVRDYLSAADFAGAQALSPEIATVRARYDPERAWTALRKEGHFRKDAIKPFLTFPFDMRHIYYVDRHKWLNEARPDYSANLGTNEFLITVPEPRKETETRPVYSTILANLHVHERGSVVFPRETTHDDLLGDRDANLSDPVWRAISTAYGLQGTRRDQTARDTVGNLFRVVFAMLYAPAYQSEHKSALSSDWAHVPIPRSRALFDRIVKAGNQVTRLLDTSDDVSELVDEILGADTVRSLGPLKRADGGQVRPGDLKVTVTYWGGGKGRWYTRPRTMKEVPPITLGDAWGDQTGDLFINDDAYFANVPEAVWRYQLGGYPVLKKWLGYRQASRTGGRPLTDADRRWFRSTIRRIAALLALNTTLDALYQECVSEAFVATDLGIQR